MIRLCLALLAIFLVHNRSVGQGRAEGSDAFSQMRIGTILPLSGTLAEYGVAAKNGIEMAKSEHPQSFLNIEFLYEDSLYDNMTAISAFNKLRDSSRVDLVYLWGYAPVQAVAPVAERLASPLIAVTAERSASVGRQYVIRFNFYAEQLGEVLAEYLRSRGFKKLGIIKIEQAFINGIADGLLKNLQSGETMQIIDNYDVKEQDFKASLAKLLNKPFDAVGVFLAPGQISQFYRQAQLLHLKPVTFGTHYFESHSELKNAQGFMDGALFATVDVSPEFRERYADRYGNDNRITFAASAYDFALLTGKLFGALTTRPSADEILKRYRTAPPQVGACGQYQYVDNPVEGPSFKFQAVVKKIEKGNFKTVMEANPPRVELAPSLDKETAIRLARQHASQHGMRVADYTRIEASFEAPTRNWDIFFTMEPRRPGGNFDVIIDDQSGKILNFFVGE